MQSLYFMPPHEIQALCFLTEGNAMKFKNERIRKLYRSAALLTAVGAVLCLTGILFFITAFLSAEKAKSNLRPMDDILSSKGNHAAKPAYFDIDREPVKVAEAKDESYYLITNGNRHYLCGMTQESFDKVIADYNNGNTRIEGVTKVIIDDGARKAAAAFLSEYFSESLTEETIDDYVGDVHIRATEITTWHLLREIYVLYIAFAVPILIFAVPVLIGGSSKLCLYNTVSGSKGVTPKMADEQANSPDSLWLENFGVYLAPEYIIGIKNGIIALRYDEIKRIVFTETVGSAKKTLLNAEMSDGKVYTPGEAMFYRYLENDGIFEEDLILDTFIARSPMGKSVYEELSFRYPFYINIHDDNGDETRIAEGSEAYGYLDEELKESIRADFRAFRAYRLFKDGKAVQRMMLDFESDGYVVVRVTAERGKDDELKAELNDFICGQLSDGWGKGYKDMEYFCDDTYTIAFSRAD